MHTVGIKEEKVSYSKINTQCGGPSRQQMCGPGNLHGPACPIDSVGHFNGLKGFDVLKLVTGEVDEQLLGPAFAGLDLKLDSASLLGL